MKENQPGKKHVHEIHVEDGKLATLFLGIINTLETAGTSPEEIMGGLEMAKLVWNSKHMHQAMKAHDQEKKPIITPWTPPANKPEEN